MPAKLISPIVNCDWFSFCIRHATVIPAALPAEFVEEVCSGTNVFASRRVYWCRGSKVMTVLGKPKSKQIAGDLLMIEIGNRWLYDHLDLITILSTMFPFWRLNNMSRVDICADFELQSTRIVELLARGSYYVSGKKIGNIYYEETTSGRKPYDLNFGSPQSAVKWKLYNKTKEIAATSEECSKPWIRATWKAAGLDISKIWRLEVSFHAQKFRDDLGYHISVEDIYNTDLFCLIFAELYRFRFVIRERRHSRKANDRVIPFLEIATPIRELSRQREHHAARYDDTAEGRLLLGRLCRSYVERKSLSAELETDLWRMICSVTKTYGYHSWVASKFGLTVE